MQLTAQEARHRLGSGKNLVNTLHIHANGRGSDGSQRSPTDVEVVPLPNGRSDRPKVPDFLKVKVGTLAHGENQRKLADEFGVSQSVVSKSKTGNVGDSAIQERIAKNLNCVRDVALDRLMSTLGLIDEEKLLSQDAKGLASVASSLSKVVRDATPIESSGGGTNVQVVVYAPQTKDEDKFEVVEV